MPLMIAAIGIPKIAPAARVSSDPGMKATVATTYPSAKTTGASAPRPWTQG